MIQEIYQIAIKFAGEKHANQQVPGTNANYLLHVSNVAMEVLMAHKYENDFDLELAIQIALLHDTIEDTSADFNEIEEQFGSKVAHGVQALTKDSSLPNKKERMLDSLKRINLLQKEVALVKLADRITNLQAPPSHWSKEKVENYLEEAKLIAETLMDKNSYLFSRLTSKIEEYAKKLDS